MSERAEWRRRCVAAEVALTRLQQEREGLIAALNHVRAELVSRRKWPEDTVDDIGRPAAWRGTVRDTSIDWRTVSAMIECIDGALATTPTETEEPTR